MLIKRCRTVLAERCGYITNNEVLTPARPAALDSSDWHQDELILEGLRGAGAEWVVIGQPRARGPVMVRAVKA